MLWLYGSCETRTRKSMILSDVSRKILQFFSLSVTFYFISVYAQHAHELE